MYDYQIQEMAGSVYRAVEYALRNSSVVSADYLRPYMLDALANYWKDKIAITWSVNDVLDEAERKGIELTLGEAKEILLDVLGDHDPEYGVTWFHLNDAIDEYLKDHPRIVAQTSVEDWLNG